MHLLSGNTVSQVVLEAFNTIIHYGHYRPSRNGGCTSIFDTTFEVKNPRSRHLHLQGRKSNIFALIAETFWVMAGDDRVDPYLSFFLPRAPQYSDDGETWSGAYGPRFYDENQIVSIPDLFRRDSLYTRRAYVAIHDLHKDSTKAIEQRFGFGELGKDRPCFISGTEVYTSMGKKPIEEVNVGDLVLSFNDISGNFELKKVIDSGKTGSVTKLCEVVLYTGEKVVCTPDHIFYVKRKGGIEQVQAQNLLVKDSILTSVITENHKGYIQYKTNYIGNTSRENTTYLHRAVVEYHGVDLNDDQDVDHADGNKLNNTIGNLKVLEHGAHSVKSRVDSNNSKSANMSQRRKEQHLKYPGITCGRYHKNWTREHVLRAYYEVWLNEPSFKEFGGFPTNCGQWGLPSKTALDSRTDWGFGSRNEFKRVLFETYPDMKEYYDSPANKGITHKSSWADYRIKSVTVYDCKLTDVYDLTIEDNHNFALGAGKGMIVHNCNLGINFYVEGDDQFCSKVIQRSGDIIFGTGSINPFEFSFLHELMFNEIKKDHPELKLGPYRWHVTNAHLYDFSREQANDAIDILSNYEYCRDENNMPLIGPDIIHWRQFFSDLVDQYTQAITSDDPEFVLSTIISHIGHTFIEYNVPLVNNLMWTYAQLVAHYIASKKGIELTAIVDLSTLPNEVSRAIAESGFRKFPVKL